jgi:membrane-bound metal-dependent hydrolase YbcI (DUF457 family)
MFIGHYAVALASKKAATKPSLGTYFMAVSFLDLLWPLFLLLGLEHVEIEPGNTVVTPLNFTDYPYSHSLLMTIVWSTLFAGIYYAVRRDSKGAVWLWIAAGSHWVLDAITHRPDLPLYPGSDVLIGLALWNSLAGTIIIEFGMYVASIFLYLKTTTAKDKTGTIAFWSLIVFLAVSYFMNVFSPAPPPNAEFLAWFSPVAWLFVLWAYWIDRHREMRT